MKLYFFFSLIFLSLCGFSQAGPGADFLGMLGKDTTTVFDSLRHNGFHLLEVDTSRICSGDLSYESPQSFYCASFANDTSTIYMVLHREKGIGFVQVHFEQPQTIYIRQARRYFTINGFVPDPHAPTYGGYQRLYRGTIVCTSQNYRNSYFLEVMDRAIFFKEP